LTGPKVGFIGLGNMGAELAINLAKSGHAVVTYDVAGSERSPDGASFVGSVAEVALAADVVVLSLPNGSVAKEVCGQLIATEHRACACVVDTSTVGIDMSVEISALLGDAGMGYVDTPVSGGAAGARARTLSVIYAGSDEACNHAEPVLKGLSDRIRRVGDQPGMAQAIKLANNFLAASALAATSEAVAFGLSAGVDMGTMLEVLDTSSGRNGATNDKFPNHVLTGTYASGFTSSLMAKDVRLFAQEAADRGGPTDFSALTRQVWDAFAEAEPGVDFTRIYPFLTGEPS
jgi:3-hydroxyisobutyrate dehydrogenase